MSQALIPLRVTFDTNVFERVLRLEEYSKHRQFEALQAIYSALKRDDIAGFVCEIAILLDGIQRKDRAAALSSPRLESTGPAVTRRLPGGVIENSLGWKMVADIPALDEHWKETLRRASQMGFRRLPNNRRGPRPPEEIPGPPRVPEESPGSARQRSEVVGRIQRAMEGRRPEGKADADATVEDVVGIAKAKMVARKFDARGRPRGVPPEHWPMRPWYKSLAYAQGKKENDEVASAVCDWADADPVRDKPRPSGRGRIARAPQAA